MKQVNPGGSVRWELIEAGIPNRCAIDLATGEATFTHGDEELGQRDDADEGPGPASTSSSPTSTTA